MQKVFAILGVVLLAVSTAGGQISALSRKRLPAQNDQGLTGGSPVTTNLTDVSWTITGDTSGLTADTDY